MVEDHFVTASGRKVTLRIFVEHGKEDRCDWAMASLKKSMAWDEKAFGREYDLDIFMIVAVSDFNMGAMENKGLNVFNDKYILARPDTATDQDYVSIEAIIAHEYFHNWTGNRITCRDWFQLCLKEGLTVFRDQEFTSDMRSRPVKRIADVRLLRTHQFPEDAGPLAHPMRTAAYMEINNFYTATVYEKGAEVVRMMHTLIGAKAFRRAMDLYFQRHDGEAATVEDFALCMADASGRDLTQFFRWYEQAGTPEVVADGKYDARKQTYYLHVTQNIPDTPGQSAKKAHHIPLGIGLVGPDGQDMPLDLDGTGTLNDPLVEVTRKTQRFRFCNVKHKPVLSLNRGFSAPVKLTAGLPMEDRLFLMAHDSDPFNRWESGQNVARRLIIETMAARNRKPSARAVRQYAEALRKCLDDETLDPAFKSLMLSVPGETDLASFIGKNVDPQRLHDARNSVRAMTGQVLHDRLIELLASENATAAYSPDAESCARRSLQHSALALLAAADCAEGAELALKQFRAAGHMTDKANALSVLSLLDTPEREDALDAFYEDYKDDHLVVDKWLSLNAQWPFQGCAGRIEDLMQHPSFSLTRPNRVRALIGAFASANMSQFASADGSGFDLVGRVIIELDAINPQVAARMAASFKSWRVLESGRRKLAERTLKMIVSSKDLSRDTFEIVSKSLK
jgi:aminopeptidase N